MTAEDIKDVGSLITHSKSERSFRAHFGGPSIAIATLWNWILKFGPSPPSSWGPFDLLVCLCFLKSPGENLELSASCFSLSAPTLPKKVEQSLENGDD